MNVLLGADQEGECNVIQSYEEVIRMIRHNDEVKWVAV